MINKYNSIRKLKYYFKVITLYLNIDNKDI